MAAVVSVVAVVVSVVVSNCCISAASRHLLLGLEKDFVVAKAIEIPLMASNSSGGGGCVLSNFIRHFSDASATFLAFSFA